MARSMNRAEGNKSESGDGYIDNQLAETEKFVVTKLAEFVLVFEGKLESNQQELEKQLELFFNKVKSELDEGRKSHDALIHSLVNSVAEFNSALKVEKDTAEKLTQKMREVEKEKTELREMVSELEAKISNIDKEFMVLKEFPLNLSSAFNLIAKYILNPQTAAKIMVSNGQSQEMGNTLSPDTLEYVLERNPAGHDPKAEVLANIEGAKDQVDVDEEHAIPPVGMETPNNELLEDDQHERAEDVTVTRVVYGSLEEMSRSSQALLKPFFRKASVNDKLNSLQLAFFRYYLSNHEELGPRSICGIQHCIDAGVQMGVWDRDLKPNKERPNENLLSFLKEKLKTERRKRDRESRKRETSERLTHCFDSRVSELRKKTKTTE